MLLSGFGEEGLLVWGLGLGGREPLCCFPLSGKGEEFGSL